eukprot:9357970-Lingulodinium_polyedra.AAC.1
MPSLSVADAVAAASFLGPTLQEPSRRLLQRHHLVLHAQQRHRTRLGELLCRPRDAGCASDGAQQHVQFGKVPCDIFGRRLRV